MKITVDIPDAFLHDWNKDRFEDALMRLCADAHLLAGNYEKEVAEMLVQVFKNAEVDPKETVPTHDNSSNALNALNCVKNDLIYRQDAINCLCNGKCNTELRWCDDGDCPPVNRILRLSAVNTKHNRGKWIPVKIVSRPIKNSWPDMTIEYVEAKETDTVDALRCSECGEVFDFTAARNWCPECGADMTRQTETR